MPHGEPAFDGVIVAGDHVPLLRNERLPGRDDRYSRLYRADLECQGPLCVEEKTEPDSRFGILAAQDGLWAVPRHGRPYGRKHTERRQRREYRIVRHQTI